MAMNAKLVGTRIQKVRQDKGLRQKDVAEALNWTDQYVSRIEHGAASLNLNTISEIADLFSVDITVFITGSNSGSPDYGQDEIHAIMETATPRQRDQIIAHAKIVVSK